MKVELNNLDDLKNKNPFKVPDGYMQGLTSQIMSQLPEKPVVEAKRLTMMDRMRPWLYMAAMFAGLGLFFKYFVAPEGSIQGNDSLLVQSDNTYHMVNELCEAEDQDYLEFLQHQYEGVLLADEWKYFD